MKGTAPGKAGRGAVIAQAADEKRREALAQVAARKATNRERYERAYARRKSK